MHIADMISSGNKQTSKTAFNLPDLGALARQSRRLLRNALDEFLTIERHAELGGWKQAAIGAA